MKENYEKKVFAPWGVLFAIILAACGGSVSESYTPDDYATPNEPNDPADSPAGSGATTEEIFIPAGMGAPPSGILEQVSWFGGGGGLTYRECGECMAYVDDNNNLQIINFAPYQNLKLVFYRRTSEGWCGYGIADFVTIFQVQLDENGSLFLPLTGSTDDVYVNTVIDADTGRYEIPGITTRENECPASESSSCSGAPEQRVEVGESAYVCTQQDRLIVRAQPSSNGGEIIRIETGTGFEVIAGPQCSNNMSWWKIDVNGTVGWVSEGGDNVDPYFICPAQ